MATPTTPNTTWVDGSGGGTPLNATRLNNMQTRIAEALAGFEYTHNEFTGSVSITATTEATANTIVTASAITFDGSTVALIEFYSPVWDHTAANVRTHVWLYDGASSIGRIWDGVAADAGNTGGSVCGFRRLTPSAAAHTYSIRAHTVSGTARMLGGAGGAATNMPGFIRITRAA